VELLFLEDENPEGQELSTLPRLQTDRRPNDQSDASTEGSSKPCGSPESLVGSRSVTWRLLVLSTPTRPPSTLLLPSTLTRRTNSLPTLITLTPPTPNVSHPLSTPTHPPTSLPDSPSHSSLRPLRKGHANYVENGYVDGIGPVFNSSMRDNYSNDISIDVMS
jgi:hypothetical protein